MKAKPVVVVVVAFALGLLFAIGLGVSGMTDPAKVTGFLDVSGEWDPSLACVMGGALAVTSLAFPRILARRRPVLDASFHLPEQQRIDAPLILGAILFGVGWGLSGYCPGPALVSVGSAAKGALVFTAAMVAGMAAFSAATSKRT